MTNPLYALSLLPLIVAVSITGITWTADASPLEQDHSSGIQSLVLADRLEYQSNKGDPLLLWDADMWLGTDINKFRVKTEGVFDIDRGSFEDAEIQGLWSRAVSRFWDVQLGIRHDFKTGTNTGQTFALVGVQGLAPYWFEVDSALFISEDGDVETRIELEYELLVTQRLILQPRAELAAAFQTIRDQGIGSGLNEIDLGMRMRYEIRREFAPYIGISWTRRLGKTADFAREADEPVGGVSFVAGVRFWF